MATLKNCITHLCEGFVPKCLVGLTVSRQLLLGKRNQLWRLGSHRGQPVARHSSRCQRVEVTVRFGWCARGGRWWRGTHSTGVRCFESSHRCFDASQVRCFASIQHLEVPARGPEGVFILLSTGYRQAAFAFLLHSAQCLACAFSLSTGRGRRNWRRKRRW